MISKGKIITGILEYAQLFHDGGPYHIETMCVLM